MKHSNISVFIPHIGCPFMCSFCAQRTISGTERAPLPEEVDELLRDAFEHIPEERLPETEIAFFGGSFTAIPKDYMNALLGTAERYVKEKGAKGIRISTRPDCIDGEVLDTLKAYGVTAVELGAQSMDDSVLKANNRGHTARQIEESAKMLRSRGFETGLQMMTGLYTATPESDLETAERIAALMPDTVRIYPTVIIRGTELGSLFEKGIYKPYPFDECVDVCAKACEMFEEKGIRVIRLGLHAEKSLEEGMMGGFYHPAMGEVVRSRIFRNRLEAVLSGVKCSTVEVKTAGRYYSLVCGQKKANRDYFGDRADFVIDGTVPDGKAFIYADNEKISEIATI
ncbi:MAG: radical SAM protein [Oscillospiraceae bacterium]|nr:radical SAM protein [Oscillospiraceae bacterium]